MIMNLHLTGEETGSGRLDESTNATQLASQGIRPHANSSLFGCGNFTSSPASLILVEGDQVGDTS